MLNSAFRDIGQARVDEIHLGNETTAYRSYIVSILALNIRRQDIIRNGLVKKQGKSEGFESCDRPIVRKRPIWVKIGDILSRVTLKFDG